MVLDGTGVCKKMSKELRELIKGNTTYNERNLIAIKNNSAPSLLDKILNGTRNYTSENTKLVVDLIELAIRNKNNL